MPVSTHKLETVRCDAAARPSQGIEAMMSVACLCREGLHRVPYSTALAWWVDHLDTVYPGGRLLTTMMMGRGLAAFGAVR